MAKRETRLIQVRSLKTGHVLSVYDRLFAKSRVAFIEKQATHDGRQMITGQDLRTGRGALVYLPSPTSTVRVER
jgi:hypothetical protein